MTVDYFEELKPFMDEDGSITVTQKHLFLLCPNNSGSTYLQECFRNSKKVSVLPDEGQFIKGFNGSRSSDFGVNHIFTLEREKFEEDSEQSWIQNSVLYDLEWTKQNPKADWRFQKSPPDILRPHILIETFVNLNFLIMVRNPYAMAESILRANPNASLEQIAKHCINCLIIQRKNIFLTGNNSVFTYEDMCDRPEWVENIIKEKYEIEDFSLTLPEDSSVKGVYSGKLENKNTEQINRLKKYQIDYLNNYFSQFPDTLSFWGYELVDSSKYGFKVKEVMDLDISKLKEKVLNISDSKWKENTKRQEYFKEHSLTESIIVYSKKENSDDPIYGNSDIVDKEILTDLQEELQDFFIELKKYYKVGSVSRILLAKLKPGQIPEHVDYGVHLNICRRMHIPLKTNNDVLFKVESQVYNFKEGLVYEFDNTRLHGVENNSSEERIHLIVDWTY